MEPLLVIVNEEVTANPDSIDTAIDRVLARAKRRKDFRDWSDDLVRKGIAQLVHDVRHGRNVAMRQASGDYGGEAKVTAGGEATSRVMASVFLYMIGGKSLGMVTGDELPDIAESEAARANGHQFNARLCRELVKSVKGKRTVRQCLSEAKLRGIFTRAEK